MNAFFDHFFFSGSMNNKRQCSLTFFMLRVQCTPLFFAWNALRYIFVQCPDGRVLKGSNWKTAPEMFSRKAKSIPDIFFGWWDASSPPHHGTDRVQKNTLFLQIRLVLGGRGGIPFFSKILLILLEDAFGRFSNLINLEPFHLGIAHIYV